MTQKLMIALASAVLLLASPCIPSFDDSSSPILESGGQSAQAKANSVRRGKLDQLLQQGGRVGNPSGRRTTRSTFRRQDRENMLAHAP